MLQPRVGPLVKMLRFALLGAHLDGSLSPALHGSAFEGLDLAATYEAWSCDAAGLEAQVLRARHELNGFNLTAPHKRAVLPYLDHISPQARRLGSVNTVLVSPEGLQGENTDLEGLEASLDQLDVDGGSAVVLGAGGVVGAVVHALVKHGFSRITLCARRPEEALRWAPYCPFELSVLPWEDRHNILASQQLVVQATPLGKADNDPLPLLLEKASSDLVILDLAYKEHGTTALIASARGVGLRCLDGRTMLREQAVGAHRMWGIEPRSREFLRRFMPDE